MKGNKKMKLKDFLILASNTIVSIEDINCNDFFYGWNDHVPQELLNYNIIEFYSSYVYSGTLPDGRDDVTPIITIIIDKEEIRKI